MKFFHTLINSLTKKDFYLSVIRGEKKIGFGFVFKLQIIAALFLTILLSINIAQVLPAIDNLAQNILPKGAEVLVKDGRLETNSNPIVVPLPQDERSVRIKQSIVDTTNQVISTNEGQANPGITSTSTIASAVPVSVLGIKNLLVLDVTASTTPADLEKKDTFVLVTADGIIFKGDTGRITITQFKDMKDLDLVIDEKWLLEKTAWIKDFARFLPFIAFFFLLATLYIGALFASLLYGFAAWLIFRLLKKPQPFKTAYSIGLYSRTFATVIGLVAFLIPFIGSNFVIVPLEVLFILLMIKDVRKTHTAEEITAAHSESESKDTASDK